MALNFYIKRNDTKTDLDATLLDANRDPIDLTGATVRFHMRLPGADTPKVDEAVTIVTAASGLVKYEWQTGDTEDGGLYDGEFEITFGDGTILTCPNRDHIKILVYEDLN